MKAGGTRLGMCLGLALLAGWAPRASGMLAQTSYSNNTGTAFSNYFPCSASDLVNQGQSTLSSSVRVPEPPTYNWDTMNNGYAGGYGCGAETAWTNTFYLNTNANTLGYTITNIATFACWTGERASQKYQLLLAFTDAPDTFYSYGTILFYYKPGGNISTKVMLTDTTGTLAQNVSAVRFVFQKCDPDTGTIYQEADVFGYPSTTSNAAPEESMITGGAGPGGVGRTNGASALTLWVKADSLSLADNAQVAAWPDSSGVGSDLPRAGTSSGYPAITNNFLNGRPAIRFSGESYFLRSNTVVSVHEVYAVARYTQAATFQNYDGLIMGDPWVQGNYMLEGDTGSSRLTTFSGTYPNARRNGAAVVDADMSPINQPWIGSFTLSPDKSPPAISIGAFFTPDINRCWKGEIAEVATFRMDPPNTVQRSLNAFQRSIIENYLSAKYDIALASGEDKYAGGTGYAYDVFGIGRIDPGNEHRNGGAAGLGLQWTAGLHANGYVFAGHNTAANSVANGRWARTWYIDTTGFTGAETIKMAFNWPDAGLGAADTTLKYLLYSESGSGPFQSVASGTYAGNTVTFTVTGSQLPDGYYTLGAPASAKGTVVFLR